MSEMTELRMECGKFGCITDKSTVLELLDCIDALRSRVAELEQERTAFRVRAEAAEHELRTHFTARDSEIAQLETKLAVARELFQEMVHADESGELRESFPRLTALAALTPEAPKSDNYVAWLRYRHRGDNGAAYITVCDSDDPGAFRVYRHPIAEFTPETIQTCSRKSGHDGPCNGWPCASACPECRANGSCPSHRERPT